MYPKKTQAEFIAEMKEVHGDRYDFSRFVYVNCRTNGIVICKKHGEFLTRPDSLLRRRGCQRCAGNVRKTQAEFIAEATAIHPTYDFSKFVYAGAHKKGVVICQKHGEFLTSPNNLQHKYGCPSCAVTGFDHTKPGTLYYLRLVTWQGDVFYKVGITNLTVEERFGPADRILFEEHLTWSFEVGADAHAAEQEILQYADELGIRYQGDPLIKIGNTELLTEDILNLFNTGDEK